uniref:DNA translocase FtsK n=1 Tax=Candidatus Kentrum sp. MB TaxID=2138164 RepID=A0A450XT92_9GAMM|nr:MAG: DNA translocase FtsK [Candidatus Kentron sp. MB]VFK35490.1 MAG: DNA translocase FtsK [Candidatus Kentron sp. MB]VFK75721.1 MAG: DNA translocase FtsK [Candidatus Kentron sp. MB]
MSFSLRNPLKHNPFKQKGFREIFLILTVTVTAYFLLSLITYDPVDPGWSHATKVERISNGGGPVGAWIADFSLSLFGYPGYLLPLLMVAIGWLLFRLFGDTNHRPAPWFITVRSTGFLLTLMASCGLATIYFSSGDALPPDTGGGGGILGAIIGESLVQALSYLGGTLALLAAFLTGITLLTGLSWLSLMDNTGRYTVLLVDKILSVLIKGYNTYQESGLRETRFKFLETGSQKIKGVIREKMGEEKAPPSRIEPIGIGELAFGPNIDTRSDADIHNDIRTGMDTHDSATAHIHTGIKSDIKSDIEPDIKLDIEPDAEPRIDPHVESRVQSPAQLRVEPRIESDILFDNDRDIDINTDADADTQPENNLPHPQDKKQEEWRPPLVREQSIPLQTRTAALPSVSLLDLPEDSKRAIADGELGDVARQVEEKLKDFGVQARVVAVHPGPVITRFEIDLAPGTKVSKISGLAKDLARSLSVISVRVVEIIPGKSVIGLELPNEKRDLVRLSEILRSDEYRNSASPLTLVLGKNISGRSVVADLAGMPHLLVAGTTGSGKSVAINAMILSLLYKATFEQVRIIMVDPKMLELSVYEGIPHLLAPVVTDMKEAANALRWCVAEMERRYKLMSSLGVRNMAGFNQKVREANRVGKPIPDPLYNPPPWNLSVEDEDDPSSIPTLEPLAAIVVIIDELADMMMVVGKKVEELIARLAQKARAAGIHLILATQRPSVDVLTGLIKANIPTRIAFQVSARVDSRTILDQIGAEQLLGHGDMLYLPTGKPMPTRVHGAFVADGEVHKVVENLKQQGQPRYLDEILSGNLDDISSNGDGFGGSNDDPESDPLYDEAVRIVTETRRASISGVQRRLKIGYNRAARMVEQMEAAGVVGPLESNGNREVLAPPPPED